MHEEFDKFIKRPGKKVDPDAIYPSMSLIHLKIKASGEASGEFQWGLTTTKTVLKSMGFRFVKSHVVNHALLIGKGSFEK